MALGGAFKRIVVNDLVAYGANGYGVNLSAVTADSFRAKGIIGRGGSGQRLVGTGSACAIKNFVVEDCGFFDTTVTGQIVAYLDSLTASLVAVHRCFVNQPLGGAGALVVYIAANSAVPHVLVQGCRMVGGSNAGNIVAVDHTGSGVPYLDVSSCQVTNGQGVVKIKNPCSLRLHDIVFSGQAVVSMYSATAAVTFDAADGWTITSGAGVFRDGTQVIKSRTFGYRGDIAALTKTAGDMAYNTNAAHGAGVGPVVSDGTVWKNLVSGASAA